MLNEKYNNYSFFILVFFSYCNSGKDYSVEISYKVSGLIGDSILTKKETYFTAVNDSIAYLKGAKDFEIASSPKIDSIGTPHKIFSEK